MQIEIRTLQPDDADRLLEFENENRDWFELTVAPRLPAFYTPEGVAAHIAEYLGEYQSGRMHPCVLTGDDGAIIGRVNLRHIDTEAGTAEVGYRIAHRHAGQGLASMALAYIKSEARFRWRLQQISAVIHAPNKASARVAAKCGFKPAPVSSDDTPLYLCALSEISESFD